MRKSLRRERVRERACVRDDLGGVGAEVGLLGFVEGDRLGRDHVHQRPALQTREHGLVDRRRVFGATEDGARARPAQRFVGRERHDVGHGQWRRVRAARDETGDVRGVDHQQRADVVGDRTERLEVDDARVRRGARDDQLRVLAFRQFTDRVVVEGLVGIVDPVRDEVVEAAAEVHGGTVREVATLVEPHPHDLVARLQHGEEGGHVRVRAGVRLDVRVLGAEQFARALPREVLGVVDDEVAAVVPLPGIALRVLVGEHRTLRLEHGAAT